MSINRRNGQTHPEAGKKYRIEHNVTSQVGVSINVNAEMIDSEVRGGALDTGEVVAVRSGTPRQQVSIPSSRDVGFALRTVELYRSNAVYS